MLRRLLAGTLAVLAAPPLVAQADPVHNMTVRYVSEDSALLAYKVALYTDQVLPSSAIPLQASNELIEALRANDASLLQWIQKYSSSIQDALAGVPVNPQGTSLEKGLYLLVDQSDYCTPSLVLVDGIKDAVGSCKPSQVSSPVKEVLSSPLRPGDEVAYRVSQVVPAHTSEGTLELFDDFDPGLSYKDTTSLSVDGISLANQPQISGDQMNLDLNLSDLPAGATVVWEYNLQVNEDAPRQTPLVNKAEVHVLGKTRPSDTVSVEVPKDKFAFLKWTPLLGIPLVIGGVAWLLNKQVASPRPSPQPVPKPAPQPAPIVNTPSPNSPELPQNLPAPVRKVLAATGANPILPLAIAILMLGFGTVLMVSSRISRKDL